MLQLIVVVLPLGLDRFALSTILGVLPLAKRRRLRIAALFAAAEGLMPAVGLLLGLPLGQALGSRADYGAGALLLPPALAAVARSLPDVGILANSSRLLRQRSSSAGHTPRIYDGRAFWKETRFGPT